MDDEKFKTEVLSRLDRIVTLLSASCSMTKAALERSHPDLLKAKPPASGDDRPGQYQLRDEMQDDYDKAIQKWNSGRTAE